MEVLEAVELLSKYGFIRTDKIRNNYYSIRCPFHGDGNERRPSCGILLYSETRNGSVYPAGFCHCFACGYAKSFPDMLRDLQNIRPFPSELSNLLSEFIDKPIVDDDNMLISHDLYSSLTNKYAIEYVRNLTQPKPSYISEEELEQYRYTVPYMYERRLTDYAIQKYDVGFDAKWIPKGRKNPVPCITFPVRDQSGNTLFVYRRAIKSKMFSAPEDTQKPLYGIYELKPSANSVILCESCINTITADIYGYDALGLFGTGTPHQFQQLRQLGINEFVICTDGDDAGRRGAKRIQRALKDCAIVWTIQMPDGKDLNDLTKKEFDELYKNRV